MEKYYYIKVMSALKNKNLKAVDFFCSGGGMSYGIQSAGIQVLAGIDFDVNCKETYEANIKGAEFIHADVFDLKEQDLEKRLSLKKNDNDLVLIGCSPCQFWSIINTTKEKSKQSKQQDRCMSKVIAEKHAVFDMHYISINKPCPCRQFKRVHAVAQV